MAKAPVLTPQATDFPRWYQDVIAKAELADNGPVRGTMVIRPYGFALWERLQSELDLRIKEAGADNVYFPLLIPEGYIRREADHVEGFAPELWTVTHGGGKELEEPAVIRPTSETIINSYFAKWVQSYRDLPLRLNQWGNVMRWELRPRLFLRTSEFLWQEGHTCHATEQDARDYVIRILREVYEATVRDVMAIPVLPGRKTDREKFAGAEASYSIEAMMGDGKALQAGTSHELGQNFARAFDTQYLDENGERIYVWQTSWGVSTRLIGALVMAHGDDAGLRVPPRLAPIQVVVLVVRDEEGAGERGRKIADELRAAGVRAELDGRVDQSFGRRVTDWELKGVPVRVEVGPRDLAQGQVTLVRRDSGEKAATGLDGVTKQVTALLDDIQQVLLGQALDRLESGTVEVSTVDEAAEAAQSGFARIGWAALGREEGEARLAESAVSVRCLQRPDGVLPVTGDDPDLTAVVARAY